MKINRFLGLLLLLWAVWPVGQLLAQTDGGACPLPSSYAEALPLWWRAEDGAAHNLRAEPSTRAAVRGQVPAGDLFRLAAETPRCADGYVWLKVNYAGTVVWTAAGAVGAVQWWYTPLADQPQVRVNAPLTCQPPPNDYRRLQLPNGTLNLRTVAMLDLAQPIYSAMGGTLHLRDQIMQGSYNPEGVQASFGTHDGGGAVDLSVRRAGDFSIAEAEIPWLLTALRSVGFAAWLRDSDALYKGSPIHIHAIAIGDAELSEVAQAQLDGAAGYLRGYDGLPRENSPVQADTFDYFIVCDWMTEQGILSLRGEK